MVKDYEATGFKVTFEPSNNRKGKLAIISCRLIDSTYKKWGVEITSTAHEEDRQLSLYEKAEAIKDIFAQQNHEIKEVAWNFNDKMLLISPNKTVEGILEEIAKKIY